MTINHSAVSHAAPPVFYALMGFSTVFHETINTVSFQEDLPPTVFKEAAGETTQAVENWNAHTHIHAHASGNVLTGNDSSFSGPQCSHDFALHSHSNLSPWHLGPNTQLWTRLSQFLIWGFISAFKALGCTMTDDDQHLLAKCPTWYSLKQLSCLKFHQDISVFL